MRDRRKLYAASVLAALVLTTGCSRRMAIKFYPTWADDLVPAEVWGRTSTALTYESIGSDSAAYKFYCTYTEPRQRECGPSDFKRFTGIVRGRLPLGDISVRAVHLTEDGTRKEAYIDPSTITCNDPQADLFAFEISQLNGYGEFAYPEVVRGRYYVFLEKDDKELCGSELTIR